MKGGRAGATGEVGNCKDANLASRPGRSVCSWLGSAETLGSLGRARGQGGVDWAGSWVSCLLTPWATRGAVWDAAEQHTPGLLM